MGGGFLLSATSQTKNPTWILRCDDTHNVQSNSSDLFGYDVVATAGEVQRPGHRTLIVSIASVVKNIIIIKRLHTHTHILRLKWDELLTSISVYRWNGLGTSHKVSKVIDISLYRVQQTDRQRDREEGGLEL